jgi:hypothetical protein
LSRTKLTVLSDVVFEVDDDFRKPLPYLGVKRLHRGKKENSDYESRIIRAISYKTCPVIKCSMGFGKRPLPYRLLYEHFVHSHYNLGAANHSRYQNLIYQILQQLVVHESNKGKGPNHLRKRQLSTHMLIKHLGISLGQTAELLSRSVPLTGELSYFGALACTICNKGKETSNVD